MIGFRPLDGSRAHRSLVGGRAVAKSQQTPSPCAPIRPAGRFLALSVARRLRHALAFGIARQQLRAWSSRNSAAFTIQA